jgi:single-stranded-DNA-specific exonuclease
LLERFGGHHAAAGVTLRADKLEQFRAAFADATRELGQRAAVGGAPMADVALEPSIFELPAPLDLLRLEPIGQANAEPVFLVPDAKVVECGSVRGAHLKLQLRLGGRSLGAFGYDMADAHVEPGRQVQLLGHLRIDDWNGGDRVELRLLAPPLTS